MRPQGSLTAGSAVMPNHVIDGVDLPVKWYSSMTMRFGVSAMVWKVCNQ
ncbi:hypothetical protein V2V90_23265 (plasmid) [Agrobacterium leguminum]